jgi:hypothetical protein
MSQLHERRSFGLALVDYLEDRGWNVTYSERDDTTVKAPQIAVQFVNPSGPKTLQLGGRINGEKYFIRNVQVDAYMENEGRADQIIDDIMDFIDLTAVEIKSPDSQTLGSFICWDSDRIYGDTLPPATSDPRNLGWRGIVRAPMEAHYYPVL